MNKAKVVQKAEEGKGLTVAEIKVYQKAVKPERHVYGKYGTLAKQYLEDKGIDWTIANLRFKRSADFMENLKRETEMQRLIEEEILNEIVYVK